MFLKQSIYHKFRKMRMHLYYVCNMSINSSFHNNIYNFKVIMILPYICTMYIFSVHVLNNKYYTPVLDVPNSLFMDDANSLQ